MLTARNFLLLNQLDPEFPISSILLQRQAPSLNCPMYATITIDGPDLNLEFTVPDVEPDPLDVAQLRHAYARYSISPDDLQKLGNCVFTRASQRGWEGWETTAENLMRQAPCPETGPHPYRKGIPRQQTLYGGKLVIHEINSEEPEPRPLPHPDEIMAYVFSTPVVQEVAWYTFIQEAQSRNEAIFLAYLNACALAGHP